jgi:hypothetical protein
VLWSTDLISSPPPQGTRLYFTHCEIYCLRKYEQFVQQRKQKVTDNK